MWEQPPGARPALEWLRTHPSQAMMEQFDANQERLEDQAKRCGFSPEVISAIEQVGTMGADLRGLR